MKRVIGVLILCYLASLHLSMAGMEIFSWAILPLIAIVKLRNKERFASYDLLWPFLSFVLAGALSLAVNPILKPLGPQLGFLRFPLVFYGLAWALSYVWTPDFERRLLVVWATVLSLTGLTGLFQMLTGIDYVPHSKVVVLKPERARFWIATGFFSQSLTYAYSIGVSLFGSAFALASGSRVARWWSIATLAGAVGLFSSTARGSWVGAFVCVVIYIFAARRSWILPFAAFTALAFGFLYFFGASFGGKIDRLTHLQLDHSSSVRFDLWPAYFRMFLDHPVFGVGLFQGDKLLPLYYEKLGLVQPFVSHAHNNFLQFLACTGILGFTAYVWLICVPLRKAWRLRRSSYWGWGLLLAQLFLQIGGLTECNFIDGEVNHMLMFVWALTCVLEARLIPNPGRDPSLAS